MKIQGTLDSNGNFVSNDRMPIAFETNGAITVQGTLDANGNFIQATHQPPAFQANGNLTVQGTISSSNNFVRATRSPTAYNIDGSYKIQGTLDANGNFIAPINPNAFKSDGDISIYGRLLANGQFITPTSKVVAIKDLDFFFGADTPAGEYLSMETSGLAIDFAQNSALVRDPAKILSFSGAPVDLLTYTSPSPKMVYGADGVLRYARHNLLTHSEDLANIAWSKDGVTAIANAIIAPDGEMTATLLQEIAGDTGYHIFAQQTGNVSGLIASRSLYVKKFGNSRYITLSVAGGPTSTVNSWIFDFDTGTFTLVGTAGAGQEAEPLVNGWWRLTINNLSSTTNNNRLSFGVSSGPNFADLNYMATGDLGVYVWGAQYQLLPCHDDTYLPTTSAARYDMPLDHDPVTHEAKGILVEEQRTNLLLYSQNFNNAAWATSAAPIITPAAAIAPSGLLTATRVEDATASQYANVNETVTKASGAQMVASIFIEKDAIPAATRFSTLRLQYSGGTTKTGDARFNTMTGEALFISGAGSAIGVATVMDCGDYWRLSVTVVDDGANTTAVAIFYPAAGSGALTNLTATAVGSAVIWGAQLEAGAFPTSYIPTTSAQVTRAADAITLATSAFPYNAAEGTLVGELLVPLAVIQDFIMIEDGIPESLGLYTNQNNQVLQWARDGGVNQVANQIGVSASADRKFAVAFKANDFAGSLDGGAVVTDNAGTMPTPTKLNLTPALIAGPVKNRHLVRLKYLPRRADNTELQELSA